MELRVNTPRASGEQAAAGDEKNVKEKSSSADNVTKSDIIYGWNLTEVQRNFIESMSEAD